MSLQRRVRAVERRLGEAAECPRCNGRGWGRIGVVNDRGEPLDRARGCAGCGNKAPVVKRIVIRGASPSDWAAAWPESGTAS